MKEKDEGFILQYIKEEEILNFLERVRTSRNAIHLVRNGARAI